MATTVAFEGVCKRFGAETLAVSDLTLTVEEGEFLILVGPSGCGKTTALRMVAGLEELTAGEIRIGDRVVNDLPPTDRDVAMVFQNYALYPHMSVFDNVAFPLRQQRVKKAEVRRRVVEVAALLGIEELLERKPRQLSGGQRQRVAIGRALVRRPQAFLMDEPLSNLDAKLRVQMRAELISLHQRLGITTVYVTHDQTEAMTLGDRVVVMDKGVVQQVATPDEVYRRPANAFVAGFIGSPSMNFLQGRIDGGRLRLGLQEVELTRHVRDGDVVVGLRPEDFQLASAAPGASGRVSAHVEIVEKLGPEVLAHFRAEGLAAAHVTEADGEAAQDELSGTLVGRFEPGFAAAPGDRVELTLRSERLQLFDPASGESLLV